MNGFHQVRRHETGEPVPQFAPECLVVWSLVHCRWGKEAVYNQFNNPTAVVKLG